MRLVTWACICALGVSAARAQTAAGFLGSEACRVCHPDVWFDFHRNPHFKSVALGESAERSGCEGCHGPGAEHVAAAGDKTKILAYGDLSPSRVLDDCLRCHSSDIGKTEIRRSSHSTGEISCLSCHSIHASPESGPLLADVERDVCYACHTEVRARFELPFKHRVNEGAILCSDCHNPHGAPTATWSRAVAPRMVSQGLGADAPCVTCHSDTRGPFVYEHPPVRVEGCQVCHDPHGSVNPRLLSRPAVFTMCLECHTDVMGFGLRAEGVVNPTVGFHDLSKPQFQNCVVCHTRIHGSNADSLFRR